MNLMNKDLTYKFIGRCMVVNNTLRNGFSDYRYPHKQAGLIINFGVVVICRDLSLIKIQKSYTIIRENLRNPFL